mgnify:CR=1 FL=1
MLAGIATQIARGVDDLATELEFVGAALADLVEVVRKVEREVGMPAVLTDMQLAAKWLRNHGYWYEPRPHSAVSEACLFIHFLVASSMTVRRARSLIADAKGSLIQRVGLQSKAPRRQ